MRGRSRPGRRGLVRVRDEAFAHVRGGPALKRSISWDDKGLDAPKLAALGPDVLHALGELGVIGQRLLAQQVGEADQLGGGRLARAAARRQLRRPAFPPLLARVMAMLTAYLRRLRRHHAICAHVEQHGGP